VQDIREALDDKSLDAVSVATPNHWHALITIWACQAGKDVYVEKPSATTFTKAAFAVETPASYNRIVATRTQSRSSADWAQAAAAVQSGRFGKLPRCSRGCATSAREHGKVSGRKQPPEHMDYDSGAARSIKLRTALEGSRTVHYD